MASGRSIDAVEHREGNGKRSHKDRSRFFEIARGSALECVAIQDVLAVSGGIQDEANGSGRKKLQRIVSILTKLVLRAPGDGSPSALRDADEE